LDGTVNVPVFVTDNTVVPMYAEKDIGRNVHDVYRNVKARFETFGTEETPPEQYGGLLYVDEGEGHFWAQGKYALWQLFGDGTQNLLEGQQDFVL